jgi:hypothetical protein
MPSCNMANAYHSEDNFTSCVKLRAPQMVTQIVMLELENGYILTPFGIQNHDTVFEIELNNACPPRYALSLEA